MEHRANGDLLGIFERNTKMNLCVSYARQRVRIFEKEKRKTRENALDVVRVGYRDERNKIEKLRLGVGRTIYYLESFLN